MVGNLGEMKEECPGKIRGKNKSCINREKGFDMGKIPAKRNKPGVGGLDFFVRLCYDYGK